MLQQHAHTCLCLSVHRKPGYHYATGPKAANSHGMLAARRGQKARKLKTSDNTSYPMIDHADVAHAPLLLPALPAFDKVRGCCCRPLLALVQTRKGGDLQQTCWPVHSYWYAIAFIAAWTASVQHSSASGPIESFRWPAVPSCYCCSDLCVSAGVTSCQGDTLLADSCTPCHSMTCIAA